MGKPKAPAAPDYAAAAQAQGAANLNATLASNYLNHPNEISPEGSRMWDQTGTQTLADGTKIPTYTVTTSLSPDQQTLYDQNTALAKQLNELASSGVGYVGTKASTPFDTSKLPELQTFTDSSGKVREDATNAIMARLLPIQQRDEAALQNRLLNQGITQGSEAYKDAMGQFQQGVNDSRIQAILSGNEAGATAFSQGLAAMDANNSARQQAIQEESFLRNEPLNMLNALRTGNQATMPQFQPYAANSNVQAAPIYQATSDSYDAAMQAYQAKMQGFGGFLGGLGKLGSVAIGKWG